MTNRRLIEHWLTRARSNLERAKAGKINENILFEDLCFDCQQAVEKSLKAWLIHLEIIFPWTHSIARLFELIEEKGIVLPEDVKDAAPLSAYAVTTRYPGEYEPVTEEEYREALQIAVRVFDWVLLQVGEV
ncbi:MAG: HEPN domain-containing protein [Syntrophales bacterium]|nr:HEPN domain-containing protein [Syntrophales bacterium]